ncbi:hypothetical protein [Stenotrophomonas acidaminiphila]
METQNQLLKDAIRAQNVDGVRHIAPQVSSKKAINDALVDASWWGMSDIVEALIPYADPTANDSKALQYGVKGKHADVVKLLAPHSDIEQAKEGLDDLDHLFLDQALNA